MKLSHIGLCLGALALAFLLGALGAGWIAFIPAAACAGMCIYMIAGMVRGAPDHHELRATCSAGT